MITMVLDPYLVDITHTFRGRINLKVSLDDLLKRGMDKATDVILTGCSGIQ